MDILVGEEFSSEMPFHYYAVGKTILAVMAHHQVAILIFPWRATILFKGLWFSTSFSFDSGITPRAQRIVCFNVVSHLTITIFKTGTPFVFSYEHLGWFAVSDPPFIVFITVIIIGPAPCIFAALNWTNLHKTIIPQSYSDADPPCLRNGTCLLYSLSGWLSTTAFLLSLPALLIKLDCQLPLRSWLGLAASRWCNSDSLPYFNLIIMCKRSCCF